MLFVSFLSVVSPVLGFVSENLGWHSDLAVLDGIMIIVENLSVEALRMKIFQMPQLCWPILHLAVVLVEIHCGSVEVRIVDEHG